MISSTDSEPARSKCPPQRAPVRATVSIRVRLDPCISRLGDLGEVSAWTLAGTRVLTCGIAGLKGERVDKEVEEYRVASGSPATIRGYHHARDFKL